MSFFYICKNCKINKTFPFLLYPETFINFLLILSFTIIYFFYFFPGGSHFVYFCLIFLVFCFSSTILRWAYMLSVLFFLVCEQLLRIYIIMVHYFISFCFTLLFNSWVLLIFFVLSSSSKYKNIINFQCGGCFGHFQSSSRKL